MKKISRPSFILGFAAAIGALAALGAVAFARPHPAIRQHERSSPSTSRSFTRRTHKS